LPGRRRRRQTWRHERVVFSRPPAVRPGGMRVRQKTRPSTTRISLSTRANTDQMTDVLVGLCITRHPSRAHTLPLEVRSSCGPWSRTNRVMPRRFSEPHRAIGWTTSPTFPRTVALCRGSVTVPRTGERHWPLALQAAGTLAGSDEGASEDDPASLHGSK
jgi:hypothetical protein